MGNPCLDYSLKKLYVYKVHHKYRQTCCSPQQWFVLEGYWELGIWLILLLMFLILIHLNFQNQPVKLMLSVKYIFIITPNYKLLWMVLSVVQLVTELKYCKF